jgi:hypothetical protein
VVYIYYWYSISTEVHGVIYHIVIGWFPADGSPLLASETLGVDDGRFVRGHHLSFDDLTGRGLLLMSAPIDPYSPDARRQDQPVDPRDDFIPPHPGSREMPQWEAGHLPNPPVYGRHAWVLLLGPALISGGSAIGGGEWLTGPAVTARYGGAVMWLATLSILGQVIYNLEISRYTLYTGEPIFTGKFRTLPGPLFWLLCYLCLDFGALFPYLASNAATPVSAIWLGRVPGLLEGTDDGPLVRGVGIAIFLVAMIPMIVGGKIYRTLQAIMGFKLVVVVGFLLFLAVFFSSRSTWFELLTGFFRIGTIPVGGSKTDNIFVSLFRGDGIPVVDLSMIAYLAGFAAIAGNGGLTNTPLSNYTRDQGWGMGRWVGSIPSIIGGRSIKLSHVGRVFNPTPEELPHWHRWCRHILRDQLLVWMPACFIGVALPSMLSVEFLPRGTVPEKWALGAMTANGAESYVSAAWGARIGRAFWYSTLICGFLVLGTTVVTTVDGFVRRWVDVFWTASPRLRRLPPEAIKYVFFAVLAGYIVFGVLMIYVGEPEKLLKIATNIMNFALGFSCLHTIYINTSLLPRVLRPNWFIRISLFLSGAYFLTLATITALKNLGLLG